MLTRPDQGAVNLEKGPTASAANTVMVGVKDETLQRAIDADVEWLRPTRRAKSIAASRQAKKDYAEEFPPE